LLRDSGVDEFAWKKLAGAKERFAAIKLCEFCVNYACARVLRVDVLIWDTRDERHDVPRRDDVANLQRMYYHLFRNVLRARWPDNALWRLHPDEHTALDWDTIQDCLEHTSTSVEVAPTFKADRPFRLRLRREFGIEQIEPVRSQDHPLLQVADLFAGLAVFSREKYEEYREWLTTECRQQQLFELSQPTGGPSASSRERFRVLKHFGTIPSIETLSRKVQGGQPGRFPKNERWPLDPEAREPFELLALHAAASSRQGTHERLNRST